MNSLAPELRSIFYSKHKVIIFVLLVSICPLGVELFSFFAFIVEHKTGFKTTRNVFATKCLRYMKNKMFKRQYQNSWTLFSWCKSDTMNLETLHNTFMLMCVLYSFTSMLMWHLLFSRRWTGGTSNMSQAGWWLPLCPYAHPRNSLTHTG